jgi:hypothetical protein
MEGCEKLILDTWPSDSILGSRPDTRSKNDSSIEYQVSSIYWRLFFTGYSLKNDSSIEYQVSSIYWRLFFGRTAHIRN